MYQVKFNNFWFLKDNNDYDVNIDDFDDNSVLHDSRYHRRVLKEEKIYNRWTHWRLDIVFCMHVTGGSTINRMARWQKEKWRLTRKIF